MSNVAVFIRARLDEDEVEAELALTRIRDDEGWYVVPQLAAADPEWLERYGVAYKHIARHDPARVLAQVAAMRAIVDFHESWPVLVETPPEMVTETSDVGNMTIRMAKQMAWLTNQEYRQRFGDEPPTAPMLRHLAAIWSSHPAYDPAWSPDA